MPRIDARLKQAIKNELETNLYAATKRRQESKLREIVVENCALWKFDHQSFSYRGEFYNLEQTVPRYKHQRLAVELHPDMDAWLKSKKDLEYNEIPYVAGFINKVLNASNSVLDYLAILPEWLHPEITKMAGVVETALPRELSDEQVEQFKTINEQGLLMLKKRRVLDLITT